MIRPGACEEHGRRESAFHVLLMLGGASLCAPPCEMASILSPRFFGVQPGGLRGVLPPTCAAPSLQQASPPWSPP
jgi:hypothetical protein